MVCLMMQLSYRTKRRSVLSGYNPVAVIDKTNNNACTAWADEQVVVLCA